MTYETLTEKRERLLAELEEVNAEEKRLAAMTPEAALAETLHEAQCGFSHEDQCGWFYEIHQGITDWNGHTHKRYLDKARKINRLLPLYSQDQVIEVIRAVKSI